MSLVLIWGPEGLATGAVVAIAPVFMGSESRLPSSSLREAISLSKTSQSSLFLISASKSLRRLKRSSSSDEALSWVAPSSADTLSSKALRLV